MAPEKLALSIVRPAIFAGVLATSTLGSVPDALAHIDLISPEPRSQGNRARRREDRNSDLKEAPCGQVENGRTDIVHDFAGGETIEVVFREYINHDSYYRVAFDVDGDDDFPLRPGPAVSPVGDDPRRVFPIDGRNILAYELEDGAGGEHVLEVTLPNVDCDNCTLQLIQYMYDTQRVYYFQCADLRIASSPAAGPVLDAELDFGQPDRAFVTFDGDAIATAERELESAAERETANQSHGGAVELGYSPHQRLSLGCELGRLGRRAERRKLFDIGTHDEPRRLPGADHDPLRRARGAQAR